MAQQTLSEAHDVSSDVMMRAFRCFDVNGDGVITRSDLGQVLQSLDSRSWTNHRIDKLLHALDANRDGHVDYEEFVHWVFSGTRVTRKELCEFRLAASKIGRESVDVEVRTLSGKSEKFLLPAHSCLRDLRLLIYKSFEVYPPMQVLSLEDSQVELRGGDDTTLSKVGIGVGTVLHLTVAAPENCAMLLETKDFAIISQVFKYKMPGAVPLNEQYGGSKQVVILLDACSEISFDMMCSESYNNPIWVVLLPSSQSAPEFRGSLGTAPLIAAALVGCMADVRFIFRDSFVLGGPKNAESILSEVLASGLVFYPDAQASHIMGYLQVHKAHIKGQNVFQGYCPLEIGYYFEGFERLVQLFKSGQGAIRIRNDEWDTVSDYLTMADCLISSRPCGKQSFSLGDTNASILTRCADLHGIEKWVSQEVQNAPIWMYTGIPQAREALQTAAEECGGYEAGLMVIVIATSIEEFQDFAKELCILLLDVALVIFATVDELPSVAKLHASQLSSETIRHCLVPHPRKHFFTLVGDAPISMGKAIEKNCLFPFSLSLGRVPSFLSEDLFVETRTTQNPFSSSPYDGGDESIGKCVWNISMPGLDVTLIASRTINQDIFRQCIGLDKADVHSCKVGSMDEGSDEEGDESSRQCYPDLDPEILGETLSLIADYGWKFPMN